MTKSLFQYDPDTNLKRCSKCKAYKSPGDFYKNQVRPDGLHHYCKVCSKVAIAASDKLHPESKKRRMRKTMIKRKYGLTLEQFDTMMFDQNGKCAICYQEMTLPHIDHNHATGQLRALLCGTCNMGLGLFKESTEQLFRAISYLDSYKVTEVSAVRIEA